MNIYQYNDNIHFSIKIGLNVKKLYLTVGISASGKTTWAESMCNRFDNGRWWNINRDHIRLNVMFNDITWAEYKFNKTNESKCSEIALEQFNDAVEMGVENIIVSDTNLQEEYRNAWIKRGEDAGYEVEIVEFPVTFDEACKRNELRHNGVSRKIIYQQWLLWNKYIGRKVYTPDESKRKAIIVDIDGTIAERFDRSPFDWSKVGQDKPRSFVIDLIKSYANANDAVVIFVSGRDAVCRAETMRWIGVNMKGLGQQIYTTPLHMRKEGDMRKDTIVKEEIFWEHIADKYNVVAVFDDRPVVVSNWHDIGIRNVIAVADQRHEF